MWPQWWSKNLFNTIEVRAVKGAPISRSRAGSSSSTNRWKTRMETQRKPPQTKRLPVSRTMKTNLPPQESLSGTRISWQGKENWRPGEWSSNSGRQKERRRVGIPSNKLSGVGQQRSLQNKSINQNINWPKVGKLKVKMEALGERRRFSWLDTFSCSLLWKTHLPSGEMLNLGKHGEVLRGSNAASNQIPVKGLMGKRNDLDTPNLVLID